MSFSPLGKNTKECFLALDIGTEAVKALVFEKENQKYSILGSALQYFDDSRPFDNDKVILNVKRGAIKQAGRNPDGLLLGLSPDILRSRVHFQSINRQNPQKLIGEKEKQNILQRVSEETEKKIAEDFARDFGILPQDIQFIDFEILEIKIDGYEVPGLSGYGGKNLEFRILASFLPRDYFDNFSKVIKKLGLKFQKMVNPIKDLVGVLKITQGILLDVGGEASQICLVRHGKIEMIGEFGRGSKDFSQAISQILGMRSVEARNFKERYSGAELTEEARKRIKEILAGPSREWLLSLKSKLKFVKGLLPSTFFLFGGGSQLPDIKELIGGEEIEIKFVYPKDFKNIIDKTHSVNNPQYINVISLFYAR